MVRPVASRLGGCTIAGGASARRPIGRARGPYLRVSVLNRRMTCGAGGRRGGGRDRVAHSLAILRHSHREGGLDLLFLVPTLSILAVFLLYPLAYGLVLSVHDTHGFDITNFVGLENYAHAIFGDAVFHRALANTVVFTGAAVVLQTGLGLFLAVLVADVGRGRTLLRFVFFAPFVLASVAVGAVWKYLFAPYFGIIPSVGSALGLDSPDGRATGGCRHGRSGRSWPPSCGGSPASTWWSTSRHPGPAARVL